MNVRRKFEIICRLFTGRHQNAAYGSSIRANKVFCYIRLFEFVRTYTEFGMNFKLFHLKFKKVQCGADSLTLS